MSDPVNDGASAPLATPPSAPAATAPVQTATPSVAAPATPAQAAPAPAPADAPAKPYINPLARIARNATNGQATTAAQAADLAASLASTQSENAALRAAVKAHADASLAALPSDAIRAAVTARAGGDPARVLDAIALLRDAGALSPVIAPAATTVPTVAAPSASPTNDPDVAAFLEWKAAADKGLSTLAARIRLANGAAIEAGAAKYAQKN